MTAKDDARRLINDFAVNIQNLYWSECDRLHRAVEPEDLVDEQWARDLLENAFYIACQIEDHDEPWPEAREYF